jgi:hypothetical protein
LRFAHNHKGEFQGCVFYSTIGRMNDLTLPRRPL